MSKEQYKKHYKFFTIFIEKDRVEVIKKLIKTLLLYVVSIKTLHHICRDNMHTQIIDNLSSKKSKVANIYMHSIEFQIRMHNIITLICFVMKYKINVVWFYCRLVFNLRYHS